MRKVIIAFDGCNYSTGALEFAHKINEQEKILLTGSFLMQADLSGTWSYAQSLINNVLAPVEEFIADKIRQNIAAFEADCKSFGIEYRVHTTGDESALPALQKETRFADLLILGSESFYKDLGVEEPNEYIRMTVQDSECPVILAPESFQFPKSTVLAYDGSDDAAFAIKQFAYLFPQMTTLDTTLVYARKHNPQLPSEEYIEELAARHYSNLSIQVLEASPGQYLGTWIKKMDDPILVSGSYGRSSLSLMLRKSFAAEVILEHKLPLFIAHR